jgi:hypothetical protein
MEGAMKVNWKEGPLTFGDYLDIKKLSDGMDMAALAALLVSRTQLTEADVRSWTFAQLRAVMPELARHVSQAIANDVEEAQQPDEVDESIKEAAADLAAFYAKLKAKVDP